MCRQAKYSQWLNRSLSILLALALFAALLPATHAFAASSESKCVKNYQVRRGDTLRIIGDRYDISPSQIVAINSWKPPYTIYVGQKYCLPSGSISGAPKLDSKVLDAPAAHFTAGRPRDAVTVYTYNYPKTVVQVRVGKANSTGKDLTTVGTINISATGNEKTLRFKLPDNLKNTNNLMVCLKDRTTSYLQCVTPKSGS
jgi:LysM repeat protein